MLSLFYAQVFCSDRLGLSALSLEHGALPDWQGAPLGIPESPHGQLSQHQSTLLQWPGSDQWSPLPVSPIVPRSTSEWEPLCWGHLLIISVPPLLGTLILPLLLACCHSLVGLTTVGGLVPLIRITRLLGILCDLVLLMTSSMGFSSFAILLDLCLMRGFEEIWTPCCHHFHLFFLFLLFIFKAWTPSMHLCTFRLKRNL